MVQAVEDPYCKERLVPAHQMGPTSRRECPAKAQAAWRQMSTNNVDSLVRVADIIHPGLPESDQVFAERVRLFPQGCLALMEDDKMWGYAISHPICRRQPPALDSLLGELASDADQYYIHDLAILPEYRGHGLAYECVTKLLAIANAEEYPTISLISVYNTAPFWGRFGFVPVTVDECLQEKLLDYGGDATYLERNNKE
ncbi:MAG: hypothetical protein Q9226_005255 [Calogaya cf. arnoldii]